MGKLGQSATTRLELTGGDWVDVKSELLLGDMMAIQGAKNDEDRGLKGFVALITDWSFTEDGTAESAKVPVTEDNVKLLNTAQVQALAEYLERIVDANSNGLDTQEKAAFLDTPTGATENRPTII